MVGSSTWRRKIQRAGNRAASETKPPSRLEAVEIVSALFQFCFWLAFTYGRSAKPDPSLKFDPRKLTAADKAAQSSLKERQQLEERLARQAGEHVPTGLRAEMAQVKEELDAKLGELRKQVAAAKKAAESIPFEAQDWSEADTRRYKIDALLAEAGWTDLVDGRDIEYEVHGMPSGSGVGYVDYVLWGDDGLTTGGGGGEEGSEGSAGGPAAGSSCMPTVSKLRPVSDRSCSTATATSTGSGTTPGIRHGRCRASTRATNWPC